MNRELFSAYVVPLIIALATSLAGFLGNQLKNIYQKYVNDKTKEAVTRTCVKAVEQLYHDLGGPEKLEKAKEGIEQMLAEKGIPISELEMNMLIESVVSEFNFGFGVSAEKPELKLEEKTAPANNVEKHPEESETELGYSEEGGSR